MNINDMYESSVRRTAELKKELEEVNKSLERIGTEQKNIVVKTIKGNCYYYLQWNENGKTVSRSLGKVRPGACAEAEEEIESRRELQKRRKELQIMLHQTNRTVEELRKELAGKEIVADYSFEVFWKDELTARVHVVKDVVKVSRYCIHPLKQIFASDRMTRYQLNQILAMRYFEKGRPDIGDKLKAIGLSEYNPLEIIKRTHGVSYNDYIWFRFPKERITSADVLVRS